MTDPSQFGSGAESMPWPPPPAGYQPPYQQYPQYCGQYPGANADLDAPYGRHPEVILIFTGNVRDNYGRPLRDGS